MQYIHRYASVTIDVGVVDWSIEPYFRRFKGVISRELQVDYIYAVFIWSADRACYKCIARVEVVS